MDDDRNLAFILRAHLTNSGFDVLVSHDGADGLRAAQEWQPEVILLDIQLPKLNGMEVTRRLRECDTTANVPIILLTAHGSQDDIVLGLDAGAQDYVKKPFDMAELMARVRAMLKLSRAQRQIDELNDRLTHEVRRKTRRLELLHAFARDLNRAANTDEIHALVIEVVQQMTGCRRVSVMLHDPRDGKLRCKRAAGIDPKLAEKVCVNANTGIAGQVFTTGTTMVAQAMESSTHPDRSYEGETFLSTPLVSTYMMSGQDRLGVLNATDKPGGESFTPDEVESLCTIADSAAIALRNVERREGLVKSTRALLLTVGRLSEYRDEETGLHLERVREYAQILSRHLAGVPKFAAVVTPSFIVDLHQAAPLHDVGKIGIPDEILNKPGKLTDEEFQIMKTHTSIGRHTLMLAMDETGPVPLLQMCVDIAYCHHERYNGSGYPRGIAGEDIPLSARIIALVDAYDAMTSERCYKKALPHAKAVANIRMDAGTHFDPDIVEAFLECTEDFDIVRAAKSDEVLLADQHAKAPAV